MNPRYVNVYGDVELGKAVQARLFALGYRSVGVGRYVANYSVEIGIDCHDSGTFKCVDRKYYFADKYNATELPLSELFDITFPTHVEEKPKPTKVRVWHEGVEDDPDVVLVRLFPVSDEKSASLNVVHRDGKPKIYCSLLRLSTDGIIEHCFVSKNTGIAVDDAVRVVDVTG